MRRSFRALGGVTMSPQSGSLAEIYRDNFQVEESAGLVAGVSGAKASGLHLQHAVLEHQVLKPNLSYP